MRIDYNVREEYLGAGNLDAYDFEFKIETLDQLLVIVLDDTGAEVERVRGDDTGYLDSVEFDPSEGGGTVTLQANLPLNYKIIILLANDEPTQPYRFKDKFNFTLKDFENALDYLGGAVQRQAWLLARTLKLNQAYLIDDLPFDLELPKTIVNEAMLRINDDGDGFDFGPTQTYIEDAYDTAHEAHQMITDHLADATNAHAASAIGSTPSGNLAASNVQSALDELQSDIDTRALQSDLLAHISDATDAHAASAIGSTPSGNLSATDVQGALNELQSDIDTRALDSDLDAHVNDSTGAHEASAIAVTPYSSLTSTDMQSALEEMVDDIEALAAPGGLTAANIEVTPAGTIAATDVQAALEELDGDITDHLADATDAHAASAITNAPSGNLAATDVQGALNELQSDIDTRATDADLTTAEGNIVTAQTAADDAQDDIDAHIADATAAHAASAIANTPSGNLASTDVQGALNELQGDVDALALSSGGVGTASQGIRTEALPYTMQSSDNGKVIQVTAGGNLTLHAAAANFKFTIVDKSLTLSVTPVTVIPNGAQKIQMLAANYLLESNGGRWTFMFDGTDWIIVS